MSWRAICELLMALGIGLAILFILLPIIYANRTKPTVYTVPAPVEAAAR